MMCLTEGKHRGTGEATWDQSTAWLQRKKPRAETRKIHQATWPRQRKAVERDERMETSSSRSSFLIVFLLLLTPPSPFPASSQGKVRPSGVCSPISAPPSQHHLGIHTPNGVSRCSCHSGACVILDLLLQFWCPVSQPWHWTCIKTHTLQQEALESHLEEGLMQAGMTEPSLLVFTPVEVTADSHRCAEASEGSNIPFPHSIYLLLVNFQCTHLSYHYWHVHCQEVSQQTEINQHVIYQEE